VSQRRNWWIWIVVIAAAALVVAASFYLDKAVHDWQHEHRWKNIQVLSRNVTRLTDWPAHAVIGLVCAGIAWWKGNKRWTRVFLMMILAGALSGATAYTLKISTGRVRPAVKTESGWGGPDKRQNYQSFPSGHTAFSSAFFGVLLFVSWRVGLLCLPIPLFVGFTRIFLGAHYFSDVVCAFVIGLLCAFIVATLFLKERKPAIELETVA